MELKICIKLPKIHLSFLKAIFFLLKIRIILQTAKKLMLIFLKHVLQMTIKELSLKALSKFKTSQSPFLSRKQQLRIRLRLKQRAVRNLMDIIAAFSVIKYSKYPQKMCINSMSLSKQVV
jgi:hypothetical protein